MKFKEKHLLILIFLAALAIRVACILQSNNIPSSDAHVYDSLGLSISQGKGYVDVNGVPHSFYPPFYPFFLSVIYKIFSHSYLAVRIIQSLIGAFSCVLIYLIGRNIHSRIAGAMAAIVSTVYFPFIKSGELLLTECVFTFLLLLIIFYLLKAQNIKNGLRYCIVLGLLLGIALLTKSVMLLFIIFIVPLFIYFRNYIVVFIFFILSIMPWTIRNYNVYHKFVPVSTQTGIGFYSSYRPANGIFGVLASPNDPVMIEAGKFSSPVLQSDFLVKKTLDFIKHNPGKVLSLELKKIIYFWVPLDWEIVGNRWFNIVYAALLPFFAIGLFFGFRRLKRFYPVLMPIVYFQIMALVFYGSPRFRLPVEPYIFILSSVGILEIMKRLRLYVRNMRED